MIGPKGDTCVMRGERFEARKAVDAISHRLRASLVYKEEEAYKKEE